MASAMPRIKPRYIEAPIKGLAKFVRWTRFRYIKVVFDIQGVPQVLSPSLEVCNAMQLDLICNSLNKSFFFSIWFNISYLLCHHLTQIFDLCPFALKVRVCEYIYIFFFSHVILEMILCCGRSGSSVPGDEKSQNRSSGFYRRYMTYPTPCRSVFTECDEKKTQNKPKKTKGACWLLNFWM